MFFYLFLTLFLSSFASRYTRSNELRSRNNFAADKKHLASFILNSFKHSEKVNSQGETEIITNQVKHIGTKLRKYISDSGKSQRLSWARIAALPVPITMPKESEVYSEAHPALISFLDLLDENHLFYLLIKYPNYPFFLELKALILEQAKKMDSPQDFAVYSFIVRLPDLHKTFYHLIPGFNPNGDKYSNYLFITLCNIFLEITTGNKKFGAQNLADFGIDHARYTSYLGSPRSIENPSLHFGLLEYLPNEVAFCKQLLNFRIGKSGIPEIDSALSNEKFFKNFALHSHEFYFQRIIKLLNYYSESFLDEFQLPGKRLARFLNHIHLIKNLPNGIMDILFNYYYKPFAEIDHKDFQSIIDLSEEDRLALGEFQKTLVDYVDENLGNPSCKDPKDIFESLLKLGTTPKTRLYYYIAKIIAPYILNPKLSNENLLKEIFESQDCSSLWSIQGNSSFLLPGNPQNTFGFFLKNLNGRNVLEVVFTGHFTNDPSSLKYYLNHFINFEYPGLYFYPFLLKLFGSIANIVQFFSDLRAVKVDQTLLTTFPIDRFPPVEKILLTEMIDYKTRFPKWCHFYFKAIMEHMPFKPAPVAPVDPQAPQNN
jgi:hypothetical protein